MVNLLRCAVCGKYVLFLLFLILLSGTAILAQQPAKEKAGPLWGRISGPPTDDVSILTVDSTGRIFAGTWGMGIYKSINNGTNWTGISSGITNPFITAIVFDSSGTLFAGTWGGGIFKSTDGGLGWVPVNNGIANAYIRSLCIKRNNVIFAGTYGSGIFRSTDNGTSWTQVNKGLLHYDVSALIAAKNGRLIAGTYGGGTFNSTDEGNSWYYSGSGLTSKYITGFAKSSIGDVFAATYGGGANVSLNDGSGWQPYSGSTSPKNVTCITVYDIDQIAVGTNNSGIMFRSSIYQTWRPTNLTYNGVNAIAKSRNGRIFASIPNEGVMFSDDGGSSWNYTGLRSNIKICCVTGYKYGKMYASTTRGGFFVSSDYGNTWSATSITTGDTVLSIAVDSAGSVYAGKTSGLVKSIDNGVTWSNVLLAGKITNLSVAANGNIYATNKNLNVSGDNGASWTQLSSNYVDNENGVPYMTVSPTRKIFVNSERGFVLSTNNGINWSVIAAVSSNITNAGFTAGGGIFAASNDGIMLSANNGLNWTTYNLGWTVPIFSHILVTPRDHIYAGPNLEYAVVHSTDYGVTWDTASSGFPHSIIKSIRRSADNYLYIGASSLYRAVENQDLNAPVLYSPQISASGQPLQPQLKWLPAAMAELYEIQLAYDIEFNDILEDAVTASTDWIVQKKLNYNDLYFWRVRSRVNGSYSNWSTMYSFTTIIQAPVLISPDSASGGYPDGIQFTWHSVNGAGAYVFQLATDSLFTNIIKERETGDTLFSYSGLNLQSRYYWRVCGKTGVHRSSWSNVWLFNTRINRVVLKSPENGVYGIPIFTDLQWHKMQGAVSYRIQVSRNNIFTNLILDKTLNSTDSSIYFTQQNYYTTYYWRVRANDDYGPGDWSEAWSYMTVLAPVQLNSPHDFSHNMPLKVDMSWKKNDNATAYHLQIAGDSLFKDRVYNDSAITSTEFSISPLNYYTSYYWRVRAYAGLHKGQWSETWNYITLLQGPTLSAPVYDASDVPLTVYLKWNYLPGAEFYRLQLSLSEDFSTPLIDRDSIPDIELKLKDLEKLTEYYWRVRAGNEFGSGDWSPVWKFRTKDILSIEDIFAQPLIKAYPNPANTTIYLDFYSDTGIDKISVYDRTGRIVSEIYNMSIAGSNRVSLDVRSLPPGTYYINIQSKVMTNTTSFVIQR